MDEDRIIERGVELLAHLEQGELTLAATMDRIELVTPEPRLQKAIIERAEAEGILDRQDDRIRPTSHSYLQFGSDVITKEGDFSCRRCGASLSTGYFIDFDTEELGPFGSSCIRKVTGRE